MVCLLRASEGTHRDYTWGRRHPESVGAPQPAGPQPRDGLRRALPPRGESTMATPSKNRDWLAQTVEAPLDPALPICDPHHHLWDHLTTRVPPRYLMDEIQEDVSSGHNIVSTVFIECGAMFKSDGPEHLRPCGETELW